MESSPSPIENTHLGSPTITLSQYQLQAQINLGHDDLQIRNQEHPGDPSLKCNIYLGPLQNWNHPSPNEEAHLRSPLWHGTYLH